MASELRLDKQVSQRDGPDKGSSMLIPWRHSVNIICLNKLKNKTYVHGVWGRVEWSGKTHVLRGQYCLSKGLERSNGKMGSGYCNLSVWLEPGRCMVRTGKANEISMCHASGFGLYPKDDDELLKAMSSQLCSSQPM